MSLGIDAVDHVDGVAIVRLFPRRDLTELASLNACWHALQIDVSVRAVAVLSTGDNFGAAVDTATGDLVTIAPKSSGLLKPFGVGLHGDVFDYALQLVGEADTVIATADTRIADTNTQGLAVYAPWLRGSLPNGEISRIALLGRLGAITARRAVDLGLFDQIVDIDALEAVLIQRLIKFSGG